MKLIKSNAISAFGGINFVFEHLDQCQIGDICNEVLPNFGSQSKYTWKDIIYSLYSIYLCGGDCIEDLQAHLKGHFHNNPFVKVPSPDTVLRRLAQLSEENKTCFTKRGVVEHVYNANEMLEKLNISILKRLGTFKSKELILDYDNTIIFNEKQDSKMSYKRRYGYQPGVCTVNEDQVLFIENRNGNSDAKSFQSDTLTRMFRMLKSNGIDKADHFRADAASYQYDIIKLLDENVKNFYVGCRNSYVEKFFPLISEWVKMEDNFGIFEVGSMLIRPFRKQAKDSGHTNKEFRLVVKRKLKSDGQLDLLTQDAYEYRGILTNNFHLSSIEIVRFYNHRGNMEKQFDLLKNDFGWNNMPFSTIKNNSVFLYLTAICRNLYSVNIVYFSDKFKSLEPTFRLKKFLFRFIILPAKWVKQGRQIKLRVYNKHGD